MGEIELVDSYDAMRLTTVMANENEIVESGKTLESPVKISVQFHVVLNFKQLIYCVVGQQWAAFKGDSSAFICLFPRKK